MSELFFPDSPVQADRVIYTPSAFARQSLLHLQEAGQLKATRPHTSRREGLLSYLFFVVTEGKGNLCYQGTNYPLIQGDCIFIDCQKPYSHTSSANSPWRLQWAHFYAPTLPDIYGKYIQRGGQPVFHPQTAAPYTDLLTQLDQLARTDDFIRDMRINEKLSALLTLIMAESWHPENAARGNKKQSLQTIKNYLDEHYTEKISLDDLAARFFINKFYLARAFKDQFGFTILTYLDHVRVTRAKQLLRFSPLTVEDIAARVGIPDPAYFSRVFKKVEGLAPGEYRKLW